MTVTPDGSILPDMQRGESEMRFSRARLESGSGGWSSKRDVTCPCDIVTRIPSADAIQISAFNTNIRGWPSSARVRGICIERPLRSLGTM